MAAIVLYGYDGDHMERDNFVESNPDHYESGVKKPPLDRYESEFDDDSYCEYGPVEEMKKLKIETEKRVEGLSPTIEDEYTEALFDTTDACILELDPEKLKPTNKRQLLDLASTLDFCKHRVMTIYAFTRPGEDGRNLDGGGTRVYQRSQLSDLELERYSTTTRKVIQQYNDIVSKKHSNSKLEFVSFIRCTSRFPNKLFITFKARQKGNGQIGTYQVALHDNFFRYELQLVLLRHVEADKILAILSLSGAAEEVKKIFDGYWS